MTQKPPKYVAAAASQFGAVKDVYHGRFPRYWFVALPFLAFSTFLGCAGSPWWIWMVVWVPSLAGVVAGLATKANTALYLFDRGMVTTSLLHQVKAAVAWSDVQRIAQQVYPMARGGPRIVYFVHLRDGKAVEIDLDVLQESADAGSQLNAVARRL